MKSTAATPAFSRQRFLALAAAAPIPVMLPSAALAQADTPKAGRRSLVLSGGGALGAYEAGVVQTLVNASGVAEGRPLPQYDVILGTSIGALNGFLVATAQWSKLTGLWASISSQNVVRLKPQYAKITNSSSGLINRIAQLFALGFGSGKDALGAFDGDYLQSWLEAYFDASRPVVTPFVWAVTNLTRNDPEYFYILPPGFDPDRRRLALSSLRLTLGPLAAVREADPHLLIRELRASAAFPVGFDPVTLPGPDGETAQYVDGGVTANTPVGAARALSSAVDVVLLAPPFQRQVYRNMLGVAIGSFDTMQRRLMLDAMRAAVTETLFFQSLSYIPDSSIDGIATSHGYDPAEIRRLAADLRNVTFNVLRPDAPLPAKLMGFDDAASIQATYALGQKDAKAGFQPFDYTKIGD